MESRLKSIVRTLLLSFGGGVTVALLKLWYGNSTHTLAFVADGIHSLFDSAAILVGIASVIASSKPPDEGHPYGHYKFEIAAGIVLAGLLFGAALDVGYMAYERILDPFHFPRFSFVGLAILFFTMAVSLSLSRLEAKRARTLSSSFLASDSLHNQSDFWVATAVLVSLASIELKIPYVDAIVSLLIAAYLIYLSVQLLVSNLQPLLDHRVLDPQEVESIASSIPGVLHCHHIRSRGEKGHHFLDLNIHLAGNITLERAHEISHSVEAKLKLTFPGLVDVVIHTEPHGHAPCSVEE